MPATSAIGAARMSGQGVATTSTANARTGSPVQAQAQAQAPPASTAVKATKPSAHWSARRASGARAAAAAWVRRRIAA